MIASEGAEAASVERCAIPSAEWELAGGGGWGRSGNAPRALGLLQVQPFPFLLAQGAIGLSGFRLSLTQCFSSVLAMTIDCSSGQRGNSYSSMTECGLFW